MGERLITKILRRRSWHQNENIHRSAATERIYRRLGVERFGPRLFDVESSLLTEDVDGYPLAMSAPVSGVRVVDPALTLGDDQLDPDLRRRFMESSLRAQELDAAGDAPSTAPKYAELPILEQAEDGSFYLRPPGPEDES